MYASVDAAELATARFKPVGYRMCCLNVRRLKICCAAIVAIVAWSIGPASCVAAEGDFVGVLALAVEDEVVAALELSPEIVEKLRSLIEEREEDALDVALQIKDLAPAEQRAKLAPFIAESERRGLALLTAEQQAKLERIRIKRKGLAALGERKVAETIGLDEEQQGKAERLITQLDDNIARGRPDQARLAKLVCERQLAALLSDEQRVAWENLVAMGDEPANQPADEPANKPADEPVNKPAAKPTGADVPEDFEPSPPRIAGAEPAPDNKHTTAPPKAETHAETDADAFWKGEPQVKLRFSFRYAPWQDVLDWFAGEAGLSLQADAPPPGTFNYTDSRRYTPSEAIDVINSVLLTKGYTLIRRDKALILINLEDGVPPNLVQRVSAEQLDARGEFELVSCLFSLDVLTPDEAETEIAKLLGPQGKIVVLPKAKQILVTETAGRLRTIRDVLQAVEEPDLTSDQKLTVFRLRHASADEVLGMIRQLLGLPEGAMAAADGSLRIAVDPLATRLVVTGDVEQVKRVGEIVELADVPLEDGPAAPVDLGPQLEVYTIPLADPTTVLQVLQTILADSPDTRLTIDEATGNLVAYAGIKEQKTIRTTIDQMERDARQVEVMRLRVVDPQLAVLAINKLFGVGEEENPRNAPRVEAEPTTRQLLIRGTQGQITQIRTLLEKMGEKDTGDGASGLADRRNARPVPYTADELRRLLPQAERSWSRLNRILIDPPFSAGSGDGEDGLLDLPARAPLRQSTDGYIPDKRPDDFQRFDLFPRSDAPASSPPADIKPKPQPKPEPDEPNDESSAATAVRARFYFVADIASDGNVGSDETNDAKPAVEGAETADEGAEPADAHSEPADAKAEGDSNATRRSAPDAEPPVILVLPGEKGSVIASKDLDALDEFEDLLDMLAAQQAARPSYTVFYLKFEKARVAADLLKEILGGGSSDGGGGGGGGLLGGIAGAAMGDLGGDLLGGLLGLGGAGDGPTTTIGSVTFVPNTRLNAVFVQGDPADVDVVERLLRIIDQEASPENVQMFARPQIILVKNTSAAEIATVLRQIYAEQLGAGASQQRQPSPEQIIRALRGGGRGGRDNQNQEEEQQKMTLSVDEGNNLLIVAAPEPLFQEVKRLVEQLDYVREESRQTMRVITLKRVDPQTVQKALASIAGDSIQVTRTPHSESGGQNASPSATPADRGDLRPDDQRRLDDFQRRLEFFNAMQRATQDYRDRRGRGGGPDGRPSGDGGRNGGPPSPPISAPR